MTAETERTRRAKLRGALHWAIVIALVVGARAFTQRGLASGGAPPLTGADLQGRAVSLSDYRGRPLLVHFWATWCPICKLENGELDALAKRAPLLTVASSSGEAVAIREAMRKAGVSFPVVVDAEGALAKSWGVHAFPTSFFLTADQRIRTAETGFTTSVGFRARLFWAGL